MLPNVCIFDDFLKDPSAARQKALELVADPMENRGNYPGQMSSKPLDIQGLSETVSRLLNVKLTAAADTVHSHCRLTLKNDRGRSGVHIDPCQYSGILFLSDEASSKGGTDFFRHRRTGLDYVPTRADQMLKAGYSDPNRLIEEVVNRDSNSPAKWERTMRVPMRFNRLVLFNPWMFHNAGPAFGTDAASGRLVCLMFFNRAL